ncbi:SubName: Full=Uncharacterized protein {ECO:0000313/EMBL:CCA68798.1} [Serendipita indica DSM 11827]|uniref:Uncharacterized protein n=1 Tax=Serendipita indica (strain DSM 11827) TaxID=1109443 RepID=G4TBW1_SERID|nr:SubName: Full=Uncharacterized protein {ECO:0000313/EMBL:CCA68798.1} [Serendipita indica DSM 11827]CCA68798.1 hypothetical protein PIIN_02660 [Serendipita indica DSM 11827]
MPQGCYELDVHDSDSDNSSNSSNSDSDDDDALSIIIADAIDPANIPLPPSPVHSEPSLPASTTQGATSNDSAADADLGQTEQSDQTEQSAEDACNDCTQPRLDKGKGREIILEEPAAARPASPVVIVEQTSPQTPRSRPSSRSRRRSPKYQPILTIRSSHGWIWNQDLFVPHYMKDRYISYPPEPPSSDTPGIEFDCVGITLTPEDLSQVLPP